ncbi:uncharacterized protein I206_104355 [Kwoniella pini CBS 10737]|uniref:BZIP domain-containing protein n=1 Tax=Kwoniella pini CBS 10737 TaxID=1296096 RepID=A0A1B9I220_9TREE|nr:uncharacterized protein I206_04067 [Kwoniella pini CBS 10737]OCF49545.1 hypothetical protein I206_04067 [Kwoniella pini CBS 10737]
MSNNQDPHSSLATLLYPSGTDGRVPDEVDSHGLMDYLDHEYSHDSGDVNSRTDPSSVAPLPNNQLTVDKTTSEATSPAGRSNQPPFNLFQPGEILSSDRQDVVGGRSSPGNPSIPISNTLARLASETISSLSLPDPSLLNGQEVIEQAALLADHTDRGEMGGKRRKLPHERAGWKEMDQNPSGSKRKRSKKNQNNQDESQEVINLPMDQPIPIPDNTNIASTQSNIRTDPNLTGNNGVEIGQSTDKYENDIRHLTELSNTILKQDLDKTLSSLSSAREASLQPRQEQTPGQVHDNQIDPALPSTPTPQNASNEVISQAQGADSPSGGDSKLSRAEQNKRAQQAFRRRREEHMKKLEMDSAQLGLIKRQMDQKDELLRDLVLALESSKIEIAALRTSLQFLIPHSSVFPLTEQGTLNLGDEVTLSSDAPVTEEDVLNAFDLLEKQSREVARQNHSRRE